MLYSLLSVHTQTSVVCKLNLWRVRRQICTEKQNNNYLIINRYCSTRSECSELKNLSIFSFSNTIDYILYQVYILIPLSHTFSFYSIPGIK